MVKRLLERERREEQKLEAEIRLQPKGQKKAYVLVEKEKDKMENQNIPVI